MLANPSARLLRFVPGSLIKEPLVSLFVLLVVPLAPLEGGVCSCGPLPPPTGTIIDVGPDQVGDLPSIVASAGPGDTIRLDDGTYDLDGAFLFFQTPGVTLRSKNGDRERVILDGNYATGQVITIGASGVVIGDITIQRAYNHAIHIYPTQGSDVTHTLIHNVHVIDPGQQGIKINTNDSHFADTGEIRCSHVELTDAGRSHIRDNCYTGGIDAHGAWGWGVRDNTIEGFWCGDGLSEHAVHFWTGSRDTLVERNMILNSARGVGFGLGEFTSGRTYDDDPCPGGTYIGHFGGIIRNNFIVANDDRLFDQGAGGFDSGIGLEQACGAMVLHNSVVSTRAPFSSIEWRFSNTSATIKNNVVSHNLRPRDGASADLAGNLDNAPPTLFVDVLSGDLHLRADATAAIDQGVLLPPGLVDDDIDCEARDDTPDIGADEFVPQGP